MFLPASCSCLLPSAPVFSMAERHVVGGAGLAVRAVGGERVGVGRAVVAVGVVPGVEADDLFDVARAEVIHERGRVRGDDVEAALAPEGFERVAQSSEVCARACDLRRVCRTPERREVADGSVADRDVRDAPLPRIVLRETECRLDRDLGHGGREQRVELLDGERPARQRLDLHGLLFALALLLLGLRVALFVLARVLTLRRFFPRARPALPRLELRDYLFERTPRGLDPFGSERRRSDRVELLPTAVARAELDGTPALLLEDASGLRRALVFDAREADGLRHVSQH